MAWLPQNFCEPHSQEIPSKATKLCTKTEATENLSDVWKVSLNYNCIISSKVRAWKNPETAGGHGQGHRFEGMHGTLGRTTQGSDQLSSNKGGFCDFTMKVTVHGASLESESHISNMMAQELSLKYASRQETSLTLYPTIQLSPLYINPPLFTVQCHLAGQFCPVLLSFIFSLGFFPPLLSFIFSIPY